MPENEAGGPSTWSSAIVTRLKCHAKTLLSGAAVRQLNRLRGRFEPIPVGSVRFGDFKRTLPISDCYGWDRGTPVDRYYLESFLSMNAGDIHGRVLEITDDRYTRRFGTNVIQSDILDVDKSNPRATFVGDVALPEVLPESAFDCIVFVQTLQYVYDLRAGIASLHRALKPGGVVLLTTGGLSQLSYTYEAKWYWWVTPDGLHRLLEEQFGTHSVRVKGCGNVYAAAAFFQGLAMEELDRAAVDVEDPKYPVVVVGRAVKKLA
jgi:SAM-dependent methyltransferase